MPLFRTMKSGDVMRIGACRVKFKFGDGNGEARRAVMLVDYGDDTDVDEVEVNRDEWFDMTRREYVLKTDLAADAVAFGVHDRCQRVMAVIAFTGPREVKMHPEVF